MELFGGAEILADSVNAYCQAAILSGSSALIVTVVMLATNKGRKDLNGAGASPGDED